MVAGIVNEDEILILWDNATIEPMTYWRYKVGNAVNVGALPDS